ncbi:hypothetical protein PIB30_100956, partial [Stylosanthes scabra]|nr:hypothetical protein [Stylosanthes scabra]
MADLVNIPIGDNSGFSATDLQNLARLMNQLALVHQQLGKGSVSSKAYTTTLQLCIDGYYRRPRSTECTDGSAVGISNRAVGKIMAKLEGKLALHTDGSTV